MVNKPEDVKLVTTHNGVEQEAVESNESTRIQNTPPKKIKSKRCKYTIDWVEDEYGDAYENPYVNKKPKKGSQSCKQSSQGCKQIISSTIVKHLTKSEIESLRQNKRDAYELMMKMD